MRKHSSTTTTTTTAPDTRAFDFITDVIRRSADTSHLAGYSANTAYQSGYIFGLMQAFTMAGRLSAVQSLKLDDMLNESEGGCSMNTPIQKSSDLIELSKTITEMDSLSQSGFGEIAAIAKLALLSLETSINYASIENVARALSVICDKANDISLNFS